MSKKIDRIIETLKAQAAKRTPKERVANVERLNKAIAAIDRKLGRTPRPSVRCSEALLNEVSNEVD